MNNPYNPWNPVTPPHFIGRTKELRQLYLALEEGRSIFLVGDWRIGKSSLLQTFEQHSRQRGSTVVALSGEAGIAQSLQRFVQTITDFEVENEPDKAADVLAHWAEQTSLPGLPPLLLVDEVGPCLRAFPSRFFERLRGMLGKIVLVLASHVDIDRIYTDLGHTSPFGNRLNIMRLGLLEPEAATIITQWGNFSEKETEIMQTWAGRHPFYLQLLGYHLIHGISTEESLEVILDAFYSDATSRLRKLWESLEEREQQALRECLQGKPITRRSLRIRGLVTEKGKLFGHILHEWLENEI